MSSKKEFFVVSQPSNIPITHYSNFILTDSIKDLNSSHEGFLGCRKRDPHVGIPFGEDAARDDKKIIFDGLFHEGLAISSRNFRKDIECPFWFLNTELFLESLIDQIPFPFIPLNIAVDIEI